MKLKKYVVKRPQSKTVSGSPVSYESLIVRATIETKEEEVRYVDGNEVRRVRLAGYSIDELKIDDVIENCKVVSVREYPMLYGKAYVFTAEREE